MALPLAPIAGLALRYGAVAVAVYALSRHTSGGRYDQRAEDAMDDTAEGLRVRRDRGQVNTAGRMRRTIRLGASGPGIEIDATALTRIRLRRI